GKNKLTPNEAAVEDYAKSAARLVDCVDGFVINLSSPNTPGLFQLQSAEFLESLARRLPSGISVWIKLSPDLKNADLKALGNLVKGHSRFGGIVLTNTSRDMAGRLTGREQGGLSGPPLFERSLECVAMAREAVGP